MFLKKLDAINPYGQIITVPETMEIAVRVKDGKQYLFLLNYSSKVEEITLKQTVKDLYTGQNISGDLMIDGYGTLVLEI